MSTQLATRPAPKTALSLQQTRVNSLAPYLASSGTDLARMVLRKFNNLTFASVRQSPQVSSLTKTDTELADDTAETLVNLLTFSAVQRGQGHEQRAGGDSGQ